MQDKPLLGRHILVIENDFFQAEDCRHYLTQAGGVIVACSGTIPDWEALLASDRVDIALLDINLGHTHSFDLARALLSNDIPVVFLSGYSPEIVPPDLSHAPLITKSAEPAAVIEPLFNRIT